MRTTHRPRATVCSPELCRYDEEDAELEDKTGGGNGDQKARRKTKKKSPHPRSRREARVLRHLTRQERQRKSRPRRRPSAHPSVAAISRARDTYP